MKHHASGRPIGKCKGCCLNMRTFCAGRLEPKTQWNKGRCHRFDDRALLEETRHPIPPSGAKAAKLARRERAMQLKTEPHYNGHLVPAGLASTR